MKGIENEDIILYGITLLLIAGIGAFLFNAQGHQIQLVQLASEKEVPKDLNINSQEPLELAYYKAQIQQTNRIAGHNSRLLVSLATVKYIGFFVGITMVFLGAIMIIKGIRNMPVKAKGKVLDQTKFKIATSSPGVLYSMFGAMIIIVAILDDSSLKFKVAPIDKYSVAKKVPPKQEGNPKHQNNATDKGISNDIFE